MQQPKKRNYPNRLRRARLGKPLDVKDHHIAVLRVLSRHRYMTPSELVQVLPPVVQRIHPATLDRPGRPMKPETLDMWKGARQVVVNGKNYLEVEKAVHLRTLKEWLRDMYEGDFVTRRPVERSEWLYSLSRQGAAKLQELGELEALRSDWGRYNREVTGEHVSHTRMISRFRRALALSLPNDRARYSDEEDWRPESRDLRLEVYVEELAEPKVVILPDAFFKVHVSGGSLNYFLEAVRHNVERRRLLPKLEAYTRGVSDYNHKLGIRAYRVLLLTTSEARRDNIVNMITSGIDYGNGSRMFLVASELPNSPHARVLELERCFSLADPLSVTSKIWKCCRAGCDQWHNILKG